MWLLEKMYIDLRREGAMGNRKCLEGVWSIWLQIDVLCESVLLIRECAKAYARLNAHRRWRLGCRHCRTYSKVCIWRAYRTQRKDMRD